MPFFILTLIAIVAVVLCIGGIIGWSRDRVDRRVRELNVDLADEKRDRIAAEHMLAKTEHVLRTIANGAGNPVLEAQLGLDETNRYHERELN